MALDFLTSQRIDNLQNQYVDALDRRDMEAWLATFGQEGSYTCRTAESVESDWSIAFILDDCRARLEDRVKFITRVWAGTFQDYRTRHIVQRLICEPKSADLYSVRSNFSVSFTRSDTNKTEVYATGVYLDEILLGSDTAAFVSKCVICDAPMLPHYMTYPI